VVVVEATRWNLPRAVLGSHDDDNDVSGSVVGCCFFAGWQVIVMVASGSIAKGTAIAELLVCWLE